MKSYFVSEKINGKNKLVIMFKDIKAYERVWNYNNNDFDHSNINLGNHTFSLSGSGKSNRDFMSVEELDSLEEAERFDKEYMEWLEVQK